MSIKKTYTSVSLFSGCGGMDEGLHLAGFLPLTCCEIDRNAAASLAQWLDQKEAICPILPDVIQVDPKKLRQQLKLRKGELDLLVGGPPCQSFSLMGKRGSLTDVRGNLLFEMVRFAREFMPKALLIEQVKGLLSAPDLEEKVGGVFKQLIEEIEALGYEVNAKVLCAADYGVPQLRHRLFIVALKKQRFEFPAPTHSASPPQEQQLMIKTLPAYVTVGDAIADLPAPPRKGQPEVFPNHVDVTPARDQERIADVPMGQSLGKQLHLPESIRRNLSLKDTTKFRRLDWDLPSLTLRCGEVFYHPVENRYLTPRDYLRLHGYRDDHILHGPIRGRTGTVKELDQHRLVANSVPPPLATAIGRAIVEQALDRRSKVHYRRKFTAENSPQKFQFSWDGTRQKNVRKSVIATKIDASVTRQLLLE